MPMLAARAAAVRQRRRRPPGLLIVAFGDAAARAPFVGRKLRACERAGVDARTLVMPAGTDGAGATEALREALRDDRPDGVFLQFPFPNDAHGDELVAALPAELDVDVMTPQCVAHYMRDVEALPPVTVAAALLLLDAWSIPVAQRRGVVIAHASPFAEMFRTALERRGARMAPLVDPAVPDLERLVRQAELVVAAAAQPGMLPARWLAAGAVAIDVGYFNPGGRGDIDTAGGVDQLAAFAPVPGGIGPMTVSALVERAIAFAER